MNIPKPASLQHPGDQAPPVEWALYYASLGWRILPLWWAEKGKCQCGKEDCGKNTAKHPLEILVPNGVKLATTDPKTIRRWFERFPYANVGIAAGETSCGTLLDLDGPSPGAILHALESAHKVPLPLVPTAVTGRHEGGEHRYFAHVLGAKNRANIPFVPGLDVRNDGGYVVAPPSVHANGRIYRWKEGLAPWQVSPAPMPSWLSELLPKKEEEKPKLKTRAKPRALAPGEVHPYAAAALEKAVDAVSRAQEGTRNDTLNKEARSLGGLVANPTAGLQRATVEAHLYPAALLAGLGEDETRKTLKSGLDAGIKQPREIPEKKPLPIQKSKHLGSPPKDSAPLPEVEHNAAQLREEDDHRPEIRQSYELHEVVDQAVKALSTDDEIYQRGAQLVMVLRGTKAPLGWKRDQSAPVIRALSVASLRERMTRTARWLKYDKRQNAWTPTHPQDIAVQALAARGEWEGIREILGVLETPFLRPDGSCCQTPGYDEETGFLYLPNAHYPQVPTSPTKEDAKAALLALKEVVVDFPFVSPSHRAGWLAFQLTLVGRPAISGPCPLFAFDASVRGSGKTRLVDAASEVAIGRKATRMVLPATDEELEKRVTSILLDGDGLALIDNVERPLGGQTLDSLLTADTWKGRLLGRSEMTRPLAALCVWAATGNNLTFAGDIIRRTLHIRLEPQTDAPEERQDFKHPALLHWIRQERPRLVAAALTVLRAWFLAGKPGALSRPQWGSFEEWNAIVPPALVWVGEPDPIEAHRELARTQDEGKSRLLAFLLALQDAFGKEGKTAKEILNSTDPALLDATEALCPGPGGKPPSARSLGNQLKKKIGRWVYSEEKSALLALKRAEDRKANGLWSVTVSNGGAGSAGSVGSVSSQRGKVWSQNDTVYERETTLSKVGAKQNRQEPAEPAAQKDTEESEREMTVSVVGAKESRQESAESAEQGTSYPGLAPRITPQWEARRLAERARMEGRADEEEDGF